MWLQDGAPAEEDLQAWGQHSSTDTVPDRVMQSIGAELPGQVSFVFACKVSLLLLSSWHPGLPPPFLTLLMPYSICMNMRLSSGRASLLHQKPALQISTERGMSHAGGWQGHCRRGGRSSPQQGRCYDASPLLSSCSVATCKQACLFISSTA